MEFVRVDYKGHGTVVVTLNRPERRNALTRQMVRDLRNIFTEINTDETARAVVLTGAGSAFCAGLDIKARAEEQPAPELQGFGKLESDVYAHHFFWNDFGMQLIKLRVPVIAAINGAAAGMGVTLCLCSDIRIAAENAVFHNAFAKLGMGPTEGGVTWLLPRLVGMSRAADILLTGRSVSADEAERIGLVAATVSSEHLLSAALERAEAVSRMNSFGVFLSKEALWSNLQVSDLASALHLELRGQVLSSLGSESLSLIAEGRLPKG